jgi:hypothetical protein
MEREGSKDGLWDQGCQEFPLPGKKKIGRAAQPGAVIRKFGVPESAIRGLMYRDPQTPAKRNVLGKERSPMP